MRKRIVAFVFAAGLVVGMATPALAFVHPIVPADECAASQADGRAANTAHAPNDNAFGNGQLTQDEQNALPCANN